MNKKLTKAQAEYFFSIFTTTKISYIEKEGRNFIDAEEVVAIVNKCTEKEFPIFQWICPQDSDVFIKITLACYGDESSEPTIRIETFTGYTTLFASEFKQLAQGINQIMEWLNEQDN